jgi:hypothetical protein
LEKLLLHEENYNYNVKDEILNNLKVPEIHPEFIIKKLVTFTPPVVCRMFVLAWKTLHPVSHSRIAHSTAPLKPPKKVISSLVNHGSNF